MSGAMTDFRIHLFVETEGDFERDVQITKCVEARDTPDALELARQLVGSERTDVNTAKIWAWSSERVRCAR